MERLSERIIYNMNCFEILQKMKYIVVKIGVTHLTIRQAIKWRKDFFDGELYKIVNNCVQRS